MGSIFESLSTVVKRGTKGQCVHPKTSESKKRVCWQRDLKGLTSDNGIGHNYDTAGGFQIGRVSVQGPFHGGTTLLLPEEYIKVVSLDEDCLLSNIESLGQSF